MHGSRYKGYPYNILLFLSKALLMSTHNIRFHGEIQEYQLFIEKKKQQKQELS